MGRQGTLSVRAIGMALAGLLLGAGCAYGPRAGDIYEPTELKRRATDCLKRAVRYPPNPAVRAAAVEAFASVRETDALPWIREALRDDHPGVRFAACVTLGTLNDRVAESALRSAVKDTNAHVQVAALFALHALGDTSQTGRMAEYLLDHEDVMVRRNAAMVIGLLDEPGAIRILARAMRDPNAGVQFHALEGMARLGNSEARQQLLFMANSGVGSDELMAITALSNTRNPLCMELFKQKLAGGVHIETRLAAARGLALLGSSAGFEVAHRALGYSKHRREEPEDSPADQILRARQLAALAVGAIGDPAALSKLDRMLTTSDDPRIQVSAAGAILEILAKERRRSILVDSPFWPAGNTKR